MNAEPPVLGEVRHGAGILTLNRPQVLNSLNIPMFALIHARMREWADDPRVRAVIVRGAGHKAFCAGGDVRAVYDGRGDAGFMDRVYRIEYELDEYISRYPKPYVALMSGITMGGGCGISVHGRHRVVTETTVLAMPEAALGLFPDVGASHFLGRCPGATGMYLALTGKRLDGVEAIHLGLADAVVASDRLDELVDAIATDGDVRAVLRRFERPLPPSKILEHRAEIDRCFGRESVAAIIEALGGVHAPWAREAEKAIAGASPTSLAITHRNLREAAGRSLRDCLTTDFRISLRLVDQDDYFEGARAILVDKDRNPRWRPSRLADVDPRAIDACFAPLGPMRDMTFA